MFGQQWSVMRNQWTDRNGKSQEDVIVVMLLNPKRPSPRRSPSRAGAAS